MTPEEIKEFWKQWRGLNDLSQILLGGTYLALDTGEYSDKDREFFIVLGDFEKKEVCNKFLAQWAPKDEYEDSPAPEDFIEFLCSAGYIKKLDTHEWHIGSYLSFTP